MNDFDVILKKLPAVFEMAEAKVFMTKYASPAHKLSQLVEQGRLLRLRRGLYAKLENFDHFLAANRLVSPSYVSFETALAHYGLIPERVEIVMSVTDRHATRFKTAVGDFAFHEQTTDLFGSSYRIEAKADYSIRIASPEKSLLDTLSRARLRSDNLKAQDMRDYVRDSLRIDESELEKLSRRELRRIAPLYISRAVNLFVESYKS
ncbi:type IV toxin-antitoxin system AbiEi family antitoxin domain-containing protein [Oligoflexus tunisiensis]|uniref:type IV toxin-antitoxin system AbiEi family antitoxin domain-containing protein n=1 Tax=Oligoflexus tunisiensis TaxID=708132 RepID=UPI00114D04A5|nr:hypothetical protein [Oligoflexus tunisiensis]